MVAVAIEIGWVGIDKEKTGIKFPIHKFRRERENIESTDTFNVFHEIMWNRCPVESELRKVMKLLSKKSRIFRLKIC